jgi:hypothetical protein
VEAHLDSLLETESFSTSKRCQDFLRYIVEETLAGRGTAVKERTIAMDVFGKGADFDPQSESIVRVKANDVRKRLAQAYSFGLEPDVRISLPVGIYQPEFEFAEGEASAASEPPQSRWRRIMLLVCCGVALCGVVSAIAISHWSSPSRLFNPIWKPFSAQDHAVLISLPSPTVYEFRDQDKRLPLQPGGQIPASELREQVSYYVGVGAAYGAARFAEQLALHGRTFYLKFGNDVTFSDLRQGPAILLGATTSQWTLDITQRLHFRFDRLPGTSRIVETSAPNRFWEPVPASPDHPNPESYSLVTRLLASESGYPLLMASGINAYDTQAAVEFLTNPSCFEPFAHQAPDWAGKNFQAVLRVLVHDHSPGQPTLAAWHVW